MRTACGRYINILLFLLLPLIIIIIIIIIFTYCLLEDDSSHSIASDVVFGLLSPIGVVNLRQTGSVQNIIRKIVYFQEEFQITEVVFV